MDVSRLELVDTALGDLQRPAPLGAFLALQVGAGQLHILQVQAGLCCCVWFHVAACPGMFCLPVSHTHVSLPLPHLAAAS